MAADVLILGCGPAGLLAAHAVEQLGGRPHIISRKVPSQFRGAQYLHEAIPGLTDEPHSVIRTFRSGTREGYAQKVYGDPAAPCSWGDQVPERDAWDLRRVYAELWDRYQRRIHDSRITWDDLHAYNDRFGDGGDWSLVLSTLPALDSCYQRQERCGEHRFDWEAMYTIDWAPPEVVDNTVLYSGDPANEWYRASRVFGYASTEFGANGPNGGAVLYGDKWESPTTRVVIPNKGIKVKGTNCDCWPNVKRIGRFGTWRKGYLVHQAYHDAARYFEEANG